MFWSRHALSSCRRRCPRRPRSARGRRNPHPKGIHQRHRLRPGSELRLSATGRTPSARPAPQCEVDCWFGGGDIRNTRLTLAFDGPKLFGDWKGGGTVEMDFFGGFANPTNSAFDGEQPVPRLRLGYLQLTNGSTTIQLGQQWSPLFGNIAVSLSHIAFPLGYGSAGDIGWRFVGLFVYPEAHAQGLGGQRRHHRPPSCPDRGTGRTARHDEPTAINWQTAGNATWPQFELRFNVGGKMGERGTWSTYVVGHYDEKDLSGAGFPAAAGDASPCGPGDNDKLTGSAVEIGAKFQIGPVLIQGNGYYGPGDRPAVRHAITQFGKIQGTGRLGAGRLRHHEELGHLRLLGHRRSQELRRAAWPSARAGRMKNMHVRGMLRWKCGPLAFGFEYMYDKLTVGAAGDQAPPARSSRSRASTTSRVSGAGAARLPPSVFFSRAAARTCSRMACHASRASSTEPPSSIVVMSPGSMSSVTALRTRRMIFPLRVFGSELTKFRSPITATGPSSRRIVPRRLRTRRQPSSNSHDPTTWTRS